MKLQYIKAARLTLNTGETIPVELIGKGRFSEAWKNCTNVYVITRVREWGTDYTKEMLASLDNYGITSKHIPVVEELGEIDGREDKVYRMPLYKPLTAKSGVAWKQFKALAMCAERAYSAAMMPAYNQRRNLHLAFETNCRTIELAKDIAVITPELIEALKDLNNNISGYGDTFLFEFAKRNLCVDDDGNLILLDALFDMEIVEKANNQRTRAARGY